jgi:hypothetical protein
VKLAVPFELRIFLVVVLVGIISVLVVLDTPVRQDINANVVQGLQQPGEPSNTLIISGIDIGQQIGYKSPTISGNEFSCFADKKIQTDRGRATAKFFLSLYDAVNGGCRIEFAETEQRKTGLFMRCPSDQKAFDFTIFFEPSLDSDIVDDELEDLHEETIPMFRAPYTIVKTKIDDDTNRVVIRFIGPTGTLEFEDNYGDNAFGTGVFVNGKHVLDGYVRIIATDDNEEFRMQSIEYRLFPLPVVGKDVFVADHQGTKQHLRTPEAFLGDFDLLFRGVGSAPPRVSTPRVSPSSRYGGNTIAFDAVGDDTYRMIFTNNRGQQYSFPLISNVGGSLKFGDDDQDFLFTGAGSGPAFNIDLRDVFAVTDRQTRQGVTNIIEYSSVDIGAGQAYFNDLAGGSTIGHFDTTTGDGTVIFGGTSYAFRVDVNAPYPMTIDQDNDGSLGGEAEIVTAGGPRIDLAAGGSGRLEIDESLFADEAPAGGETINFAFATENGDIDASVTSGVSMIKNDASGMEEGLSQFGVFVQLDDRRDSARDLVFNMPSGQRSAVVTVPASYSAGGQAQGQVLVTCERSEFVKKAQAAKAK